MDGLGRAFDNIFVGRLWRSVKHEDVYLNVYAIMGKLLIGLTQYFVFTTANIRIKRWRTGPPMWSSKITTGDGAMILDKYGDAQGFLILLRSIKTAFEEYGLDIPRPERMIHG